MCAYARIEHLSSRYQASKHSPSQWYLFFYAGIAKLSDFGFAVCLDESDSLTSRACVGSSEFIAP
jgi:hypothetical protein